MNRWFWPAALALLATMGLLMFQSIQLESQTYDEGFHIAAGFSYWKMGDYRLNPEHPPLAKLLCALPLLFTQTQFPHLPEAWKNADQVEYFGYFVYRNKLDADRLLLLARSPTIILTLLLGLAIVLYTRWRYSVPAALAALFFFITDPNFLAHGRYITTDVPLTLFVFLAVITWLHALDTGRPRHFAWAALALGLALGAKFSAVFLIPVHLVVALVKRRFRAETYLATCAAGLLVVALLYAPETARVANLPSLSARISGTFPLAQAARQVADDFHLPAHPYLTGLWDVLSHNHEGHRSYLNGKVSTTGDWRYFPTAFAVKTPTAPLVLAAPAIAFAGLPAFLIYPAAYAIISISSNLNIGLRHLLPIYPFLFILAGYFLAQRLPRRVGAALFALAAALQIFELARVQPHYLAFFNTHAGGPEKGHLYLLDSNLDWGQDARKLGRWRKQQNLGELCISYFGTASLDYYEIPQIPLLNLPPGTDPLTLNCVAAISANHLYDVYTTPNQHAWARALKPMGRIGYSIFLFDLRKPKVH
ncbi:MAG: glycosyltransferase family 39 protein [Bryobacterales bacterium]|nr:glycosyltransferase family 39 protein [Bryobacterales bacterium]